MIPVISLNYFTTGYTNDIHPICNWPTSLSRLVYISVLSVRRLDNVMIFYLSDDTMIDQALELTGLDLDELESIVGRFAKHSCRAGSLRGEVLADIGGVTIRHHFTKKILWTSSQNETCIKLR